MKLFIDDERFPPNDGEEWIVARTLDRVVSLYEFGCRFKSISFDHDLGEGQPTGMDIAKWLVGQDINHRGTFPEGFTFYVHSQNPVGKANIEGLLNQYLSYRK